MISVIIPIFNAENYIHRCIDSILAQSYVDFELLLIDDGSTDSSGSICNEYALADNRVRVFHKENGGVSSARNMGLQYAHGEWITFVDSDDWIEKDALYNLYGNIVDSDLVIASFVYEKTSKRVIEKLTPNTVDISFENLSYILMSGAFMVPYCKLYRKDIIEKQKIRFDENVHSGEDSLFVFSYLLHIKKISAIDDIIYHYCITGEGLSTKTVGIKKSVYLLDCFYTILKQFESKYPGYDMSKRYLWLVHEIFYKITRTEILSKDFFTRIIVYKELVNLIHFRNLFNDNTIIPKGGKRKIFDYLGLKKYFVFLAFYSYYYDYK